MSDFCLRFYRCKGQPVKKHHHQLRIITQSNLQHHTATTIIKANKQQRMKLSTGITALAITLALCFNKTINAQVGLTFIQRPIYYYGRPWQSILLCTRGGGLISPDGWRWDTGAVPLPGGGAAPEHC